MSDLGQRIAGLTPQKRELLLKRLAEQKGEARGAAGEPIRPRPEPDGLAPLSFGQQRLWFLEQLEPGTGLYNLPISTRFVGLLELGALQRSLDEVVRRHEALRTTFELQDGEPRQRVQPPRPLPLPVEDLSELPEAEREAEGVRRASLEAARPFDLERGPLLRALLLRLGPVEHVLVLTMHHAVSDGWSMGVLVREVRALYQGFWSGRPAELPALPVQYADFAAWQRSSEHDGALARQLEWWKGRLAGELPVLQLPADRPRPAVQGHAGAAVRFQVPGTLVAGLRALAEGEGASLFMALLAAFDVLLARYARVEDVLVGTPIANRNRRELEGLIGFFVNTLVLRTDLSAEPTFRELLARVRETALGAYAHQDLPFERLVEELQPERGLSHSPLFQVMFILQNPLEGATMGEGDFDVVTRSAKFDLTLSLAEVEGGLAGILEYRTDLFEPASAARLCSHYQQLLGQALQHPDTPIGALALMDPAEERRVLLAWSVADEQVAADAGLHELFAQQASVTPQAVAVIDGRERLSYGELERRANQLAHHLRRLGIGPGARVGVCLAREAALLVAVLGVLKAGAAYVPLDPAYPRRRLEFMIADAEVALVVTHESLGAALPEDKGLCLDRAAAALECEPGDAAPVLERAPELAYVIYTSGSTGRPKGVPVRHKSAAVVVEWALRTFSADELAVMLAGTSLSWDPSVFELFAPLCSGGALLLAENVLALHDLPAAAEVTCVNTVPSALEALLARAPLPAGLRTLVLAGEPLRRATVAKLAALPGLRVVNAYGPTEDTIFSTWAEVDTSATDDPPIGSALPNTRTYVLDPQGRPVPAGVPGELHLAGDGLSSGYLNQPELTRERFLPDPFSSVPGARLYRTGDLVRWRDDGQLAFLGRVDEQVKVRGFRVEPGELEAALREHPQVREAVVVVREEHGTKSLVAYVSAAAPEAQDEARAEHVAAWSALFDEAYAGGGVPADPASDFAGWNSHLTGEPIPAARMTHWVEQSVARLRVLAPRRVLEIGCGTGLLLQRLAPECLEYWGTEVSERALAGLGAVVEAAGASLANVRLLRREAADLESLPAGRFDLVVLNSVAQYLGDALHLLAVLSAAVKRLAPGGRIVVGDVRSLPLAGALHASRVLSESPERDAAELVARFQRSLDEEPELLLSPELFLGLAGHLPGVSSVRLQLKRDPSRDELASFRYDVLIETGTSAPREPERRRASVLSDLDQELGESAVLFTGLGDARVAAAVLAAERLASGHAPSAEAPTDGVDPEDVFLWAERHAARAVACAPSAQAGRLDVLVGPRDALGSAWGPPRPVTAASALDGLASAPLRKASTRRLAARLREHLRERVPEHVWPAHLVVLDALPRLASGKVDRRALPAPVPAAAGGAPGQVPRGQVEGALAALFSGLLGVAAVGRGDDFFALGGHSLLATQLVARIRMAFGVDLPLRRVFEAPRLAELAAAIEAALAGAPASQAPLVPVARDGMLPLSYAQQRLYFLERLEPGTTAYAMPGAFRLRGPLDTLALERALTQIVARHEPLRTTFAAEQGVPRQVIAAPSAFELATFGLDHEAVPEQAAARHLVQEAARPYDLERGPLFRASLLRLRADDHVLLLGMHHAISDGWSLGVLLRELNLAYARALEGRPAGLPPLAVQYADYAVWQRRFLEGGERERQLAYWRAKLGSEPARLELGEDGRRSGASRQALTRELRLPAEVAVALGALARDEQATLFMTLLAAFQALLARLAGTHDVVVGSPVLGRQRAELEPLVGMFVNTLALRTDLSGARSFRELLGRVRTTAIEGLAHQDVPFEALVEELRPARRLDGTPFFSVFFNLLGSDRGQASGEDGPLRFEAFGEVAPESKFDLTLYAREASGELSFELVADAARFSPERLKALALQLDGLLRQVAADPDVALEDVVLTAGVEPGRLPDPTLALPWRDEGPLPRRLVEVAASTPERPALRSSGAAWSYGRLAAQSHRVAQALRQHGVARGEVVALYARRAPELPAALFGVLEAGAAFLILDPAHPPVRQLALLGAARPVALLEIETPLPAELEAWATAAALRLRLELVGPALAAFPPEPVGVSLAGDDLAYLAFTSGTTGAPKGIRGPHAPLAHFVAWQARTFELRPDDCFAMLSGLSHDPLLRDVFTPLALGARLAIPEAELLREPARLQAFLRAEGVTVAHLTPALGRVLAAAPEGEPLPLRLVFFGGDALTRRDLLALRRRAPQARCVNFYGATETPQAMAFQVVGDEGPERVPLGCGVDGAQLLVVSEAGRLAGVGEVGEILVRSPYLAEGYLDDPAATEARFAPNPFGAQDARDRVYRTGDRGRYRTDGAVEFVGRADDQLKLRGFRVEPGDVAAVLARVAGVADVAVAARPGASGEACLVAYVVPAPGTDDVAERCRQAARAALPDYMQPAAVVALERLPLTPNGKLDRQQLPSPPLASARPYEAPATETERLVASIWSDVLGAVAPGRDDVFFELGGHSLLALQVVARLRAALGVDVPVRALFEAPSLRGFAERVERASGGDDEPPLGPAPRGARVPLSFAQRRLWFLDQLEPHSPSYNVSAALLLDGPLQVPAFQRALAALVSRHDALRTRFVTADGEAWQVCDLAVPEGPSVEDLSAWPEPQRLAEAQARAASESQRPFDLSEGPLFRARLLRLSQSQHALLWTVHHAVTDGWSFGLFLRELSELYEAECQGRAAALAALPVQYGDFAAWQRARLAGPKLAAELSHWRAELLGAPALLDLPTDHPRPAVSQRRGRSRAALLPAELHQSLQALARETGGTLYVVLLAAFQALLGRLSGQDDVVVGTPVAGRSRAELEGLIGFFANTLALRADLSGQPSFRELLGRVRERVLQAFAHQELPFESLVEELKPERSLAHAPLFQVMFVLQNTPGAGGRLGDLRVSGLPRESSSSARFDLTLTLAETGDGLLATLEYDCELFEDQTAAALLERYRRLLAAVARDADLRPADVPLLDAAEEARVRALAEGPARPYPLEQPFRALFEQQVRARPAAPALVFEGRTSSYAELDRRAHSVAEALLRRGISREALVGIAAEDGLARVAAVLGVWKAGAAYLPLDPQEPKARRAQILGEAQPALLLLESATVGSFGDAGVPVLTVEDALAEAGATPEPLPTGRPEDLAYVIYTSGSTGRPKGVELLQRGLVNLALAQAEGFGLTPESRVLQFAAFTFDASVSELAMTLASGGCLVTARRAELLAGAPLLALLRQERISAATLTPSLLALLPEQDLPDLQVLISAGEACPADVARRWSRGRRFFNAYGPSEVTVCATLGRHEGPGDPSIGRPLPNTRALVLDGRQAPVPAGVAGELYVGGAGLARGYRGLPDLTAQRFVHDPATGERLYRTGDAARMRADGRLDFLGRLDDQAKLRGQRVEPAEVEAALRTHPAVLESAAAVRGSGPQARLSAWVVLRATDAATPRELREHLAGRLPAYLVPAAVALVDGLPRSASGKLDRRALPEPGADALDARPYEPPASPDQRLVAGLFAELLQQARVGAADHFFDLGGHSLLATQLVSRLRDALGGVELPLRQVFETPTVAGLAAAVELHRRAGAHPAPPLVRAERTAPIPLSFAQQRLWFLDQLHPGSTAYHMPFALHLRGALDATALERALSEIVRRHEALRTRFVPGAHGPVQVVEPASELTLPTVELGAADVADTVERDARLRLLADEEARRPFDLERGPVSRFRLLRLGASEHVLLVTFHHVVSDGWSMGLFVRELSALYEAFGLGAPSPLPELRLQYADFAAWQRGWLQGQALQSQVDYWREKLGDLPVLELPADFPRRGTEPQAGDKQVALLPRELQGALERLARKSGASLFMVLLAGYQALLSRLTGQRDVAVGAPIANRQRAELEPLLGFFVNTLVLRTDLSGDPTFAELVERVREVALGAYAHQDLPFEKLVEELQPERDLGHSPLFRTTFALQNASAGELKLGGLEVATLALATGSAKFELSLSCAETPAGLLVTADYDTGRFRPETIARLLHRFEALLSSAAAEPERRVVDLPLLLPDEPAQLAAWNATARPVPNTRLLAHIEGHVRRAPQAPAISARGTTWSYAELWERASALAVGLRAAGVSQDALVAVCAERTAESLAGQLGVLMAGAAYLPLDPDYPRARLEQILEEAAPLVTLVDSRGAERLGGLVTNFLRLDDGATWEQPAGLDALPASEPRPDQLAYVIYTSGSTGRPKGVMVPHRGLDNLVAWHVEEYGVTPQDRATLLAGPGFDAAVWETWPYLAAGASLHVPPDDVRLRPAELLSWLADERITLAFLPTPLCEAALREEWPSASPLRALLTGGDRLRQRPGAHGFALVNHYGPTECSVVSTCGVVEREGAGAPDIGRPIANVQAHVLDESGRPLPPGVPGELWIGGAALARGYWRRPDLTAERFLEVTGLGRLYRTGDRARFLPDGRLEFLGRVDEQVKLRGYRIEPAEIEGLLREQPGVRDAAVIAREDAPGESQLVAYVVPGEAPAAAGLVDARVAEWEALFDQTYASSAPAAADFDVVGWQSSYTGAPLPEAHMRAWVDGTVERLRALAPRRVLEIGCGTGLLLFRLAPECERYCATDLSSMALRRVAEEAERRGLTQVQLRHQRADALHETEGVGFDLVVLNSVAQYFPDGGYLRRVLHAAAAALRPGGTLFVGDVRSLPLHEAFHATAVLQQSPDTLRLPALRERLERRLAQEEELLVHPAFFAKLAGELPALGQVELLLRRGQEVDELTQFRYDALLRVGPRAETPVLSLDWAREAGGDLERAAALVAGSAAPVIVLRGLPNARLSAEVEALRLLRAAAAPEDAASLRQAAASARVGACDPEQLWNLGARLGRRVNVSWNADGASGRVDVVFRRPGVSLPLPEAPSEPWSRLTNTPLAQRQAAHLVAGLRATLVERLPDYMVPRSFVLLEELPVTRHGKLDRRALPAPEAGSRRGARFVAPRTPAEAAVAAAWREVLRLESVGVDDDFFEAGGHSLLATQVVTRLRASLGVDLPVRALFEARTVARLAALCTAARRESGAPALRRGPRGGNLPLSFAQQRLFFLDRLEPQSAAYNVPAALLLRGALRADALGQALSEIRRRHEALRTRFALVDGEAVQVVDPPAPLPLPTDDLSALPQAARLEALEQALRAEARRPFDLEQGPLLRARLLRLGEGEHALVLVLHHIVCDGWSMGVLVRELTALYASSCAGQPSGLPELQVQYADFALWQREWLQGEALERQLAFWRETLRGPLPLLDLPSDRPRPKVRRQEGARLPVALPAELHRELQALAQAEGATLFMALLAGFQALLARYTGQEDVRVGTPVANRVRPELEGLVGFFANTLVLRTDLSGDPSFRELLGRVRETAFAAFAHQDVPFERVVEELQPIRDQARPALFPALFALQNAPGEALRLGDLELGALKMDTGTAKFDLTLSLGETPQGLQGSLEYDATLFDAPRMERFLAHYERLLQGFAADPDRRLSETDLLDASEQAALVQAARGPAVATGAASVLELFDEQVALGPERIALLGDGRSLSYAELQRSSDALALRLLDLGAAGGRVGLVADRTPETLVAVLGILKAGAACVPLDPSLPGERLAFLLEDAGLQALVRPSESALPVATDGLPVLVMTGREALESHPSAPVRPSADDPVYVLYTSGSTGRPKGVVQRHGMLANLVAWQVGDSRVASGDVTLQFAPLSFDVSFQELFATWCSGGTLCLVPEAARRDPERLHALLVETRAARLFLPFAALQPLAEAAARASDVPLALRELITAGEALQATPALRAFLRRLPDCRLVNQYGPTETHVVTAYHLPADPGEWDALPPIGRAVAGQAVYVVDRQLRPVPNGVAGQIAIAGVGVALGYLARPELTAERFRDDRFTGRPMYLSGDQGRVRSDGQLEFLGREDDQVKLRGYRVELGEVEAALAACPGVRAAAAAVREGALGRRLLGYVVTDSDGPSDDELRRRLALSLPEPLRPAAFVRLTALPLTPSGKLDRRALPEPAHEGGPAARQALAPRDETELRLLAVFEEVLERRDLGVSDSFFDLGGHSLLALRLLARVEAATGARLPVASLFEQPTVLGLARLVRGEQPASSSPLVTLQATGANQALYLVPAAGGSAFAYVALARHFAGERPVYAFQAPGLEADEQPVENLTALAALHVAALRERQPHGPYLLGGWSLGGVIAHEMAAQLEAAGERVTGVVLLDSYVPDPAAPAPHPSALRSLFLLELGALPPDVGGETVARRFEVFSSGLRASAGFQPTRIAAALLLLRAEDAPDAPLREPRWASLGGALQATSVPGDHFALLREPNVATVAQRLLELLRALPGEPAQPA